MFLFGGEKHCFECKGKMPKLGFSVKQGSGTEKSVQRAAGAGYGSRIEACAESRRFATGPYGRSLAARSAVTPGVTGQKSAEAIAAVLFRRAGR
jgi:hypothetical protein